MDKILKSKRFNAKLAVAITIPVIGMAITAMVGFNSLNTIAHAEECEHVIGVPPIEELDYDEYYAYFSEESKTPENHGRLAEPGVATSCDLSLQYNFPAIEDQVGLGACTSMATAYYQFTFEAYKGSNVDLKDTNNRDLIYSPSWAFNLTNGGVNKGAFIYKTYNVLRNQGCLKIGDYAFDANNFSYAWSTDTDAMIDALNLRIIDDGAIRVSGHNATTNLDSIKSTLYGTDGTDGHVLTFSTEVSGWQYKDGVNLTTDVTESVAYRCYDGGGGHTMTIVGYNDNIWCDINSNGIQDSGELGAFKIANSWGTGYQNNGYVWVAYDALNSNSAVAGDWEIGYPTTRQPIFQYEVYGENTLYWMEVGEKVVYYVGELTIDTDYINTLSTYLGRSSNTVYTAEELEHCLYAWGSTSNNAPHVGTLVFDYDDLCSPIGNYISGCNWYINLVGRHNATSFKITDNLSNTIVDFGSISNGVSYMPISLSMGDLNYDGVVNDDDSAIYNNAISGTGTLSNLQEYLSSNMNTQNDNCTITYTTGTSWIDGQSGDTCQNVQIRITNNSNAPIRNWAIRCNDFCGTTNNEKIWNGTFYGDYIIKNLMYNSDIPVNGYIDVDYILINPTGETPVFSLCSYRTSTNDYTANVFVQTEWGDGFTGIIRITNTTNEPIMAWELTFDAVNFSIENPCGQFIILNQSGNTYTITGTYNGNIPIPANSYIELQFNGTNTGTPSLDNVSMTEVVFD